MIIGVPKEMKTHEYRVGLTPAGVRELTQLGHQVLVQTDGIERELAIVIFHDGIKPIKATT